MFIIRPRTRYERLHSATSYVSRIGVYMAISPGDARLLSGSDDERRSVVIRNFADTIEQQVDAAFNTGSVPPLNKDRSRFAVPLPLSPMDEHWFRNLNQLERNILLGAVQTRYLAAGWLRVDIDFDTVTVRLDA
jgi:hypothetical protein